MEPKIDIEFCFAKSESTYEVDIVASRLEIKKRVKCFKTNFMNGFMNERSANFNKEGFEEYNEIINTYIGNSFTGPAGDAMR